MKFVVIKCRLGNDTDFPYFTEIDSFDVFCALNYRRVIACPTADSDNFGMVRVADNYDISAGSAFFPDNIMDFFDKGAGGVDDADAFASSLSQILFSTPWERIMTVPSVI